jgi:hypothetical protein
MGESVLKDYGWCKVTKKDAKYFISFDEGQTVIKMNSYQITEQEAGFAVENEIEAEKIARSIQNKNKK